MKTILCLLLVFSASMLNLSHAKGGLRFGTDIRTHHIIELEKDGNEETSYLGYYTETEWFGLGVGIEDKGYIIGIKGQDKFVPLNEDLKRAMQEKGFLPMSLPEYKISMIDYIFGYSLYIVIIGILLWGGMQYMLKARR